MPDQHCPTCGAARSTGCGCVPGHGYQGAPGVHPDPSLDETAVLPHLEGPPLVRPYVPEVFGLVAEEPTADAIPVADPFATSVLPPVPPGPPAGPNGPSGGEELGFFPFDNAPTVPTPAEGGGRAARRAAEERPLAQRKLLLAGAGAALVALTIGVAYAVTPSAEPTRQAEPLPTTTLAPAPVDPPTLVTPSPTAQPTSEAPSPSATPTTHKPSPTRTVTPTTQAASPVPPPAPPEPTPTPTATTPTPTATTPPRVLKYGMSGPDVTAMQQKLAKVICWAYVPVTGTYDDITVNTVAYFQDMQGVRGDKQGVFGPNTRAALDGRGTSC
ncbi:peptidoglycan-binding protein [Kitasatospora sp. NPDC051170]|uniref:peptidoglycan-binding domain-containing protein n=1 Tax=Kitasatospora sp. NPDC051170 TaxID=3364056 RepID=UPI0037991CA0